MIKRKTQEGQALVTLLFFVIMSITITTAAVTILAVNTITSQKVEQSLLTYNLAESAIENALMRLIRDPEYTGETINFSLGSAVVDVVGDDIKTITAVATSGGFQRTVVVEVDFVDNVLSTTSWKSEF